MEKNDFDWKTYINNYKDLQKDGINTQEKALQHWNNHGKYENRTDKNIINSPNYKFVLCAVFKNESHILQRMIDSCKDICDAFCFVDTGSTDSTKDIIQSFLQNNKGYLFFDPFINFGKNRTNHRLPIERKAEA